MKDFRINDSVEELRVIANTSSMPYAGQDQSGTEIGRILGVHGVLTGRVRRTAERFRVNIELLNVETGEITWANSFDADLTLGNVLDVQERIAAAVAREMQVLIRELETPESRPTSLVALDAYNDGLYHSNLIMMGDYDPQEASETWNSAVVALGKAINADPSWSAPRAMLGQLYLFRWNGAIEPDAVDLATSRRHLLDAIRLDEEFGPAHASFGALLTFERRYDAALVSFNRAISLGSEDAFWGLGLLHRFLGQHEKAFEAFRRAIAVYSLVLPIRYQLAETHYCCRQLPSCD